MIPQADIHFEPSTHTYTRNGKKYISATTVVGEFKKPFNRRYWAMFSTLKETFGYYVRQEEQFGIMYVNNRAYSIDELYGIEMYREAAKMMKNGWDETTKTACDRGNKIHDYLEISINTSKGDKGESNTSIKPLIGGNYRVYQTQHDIDVTDLKDVYPEIHHTLSHYISKGCTIYAEKKLYIDEYEVSGMIDCLIVKGNQFIILDWKTNKDIIYFKSGYYKKENINGKWIKGQQWVERPKYLLKPLDHLEDSKGILYSLQVSLYAYMFESWGYKLLDNGLFIYHIRPNERPERIPVPYLKDDIKTMLDYYKLNKAA